MEHCTRYLPLLYTWNIAPGIFLCCTRGTLHPVSSFVVHVEHCTRYLPSILYYVGTLRAVSTICCTRVRYIVLKVYFALLGTRGTLHPVSSFVVHVEHCTRYLPLLYIVLKHYTRYLPLLYTWNIAPGIFRVVYCTKAIHAC